MNRPRTIPFNGRATSAHGFTVCELMVVLAVAAIIALIMIPQSDGFNDQRLVSATRLLIADLEYAQMRSMGDATDPCVVVLDSAANTYRIARQSDPATPIDHPSTGAPYARTFGDDPASSLSGVALDRTDPISNGRIVFTGLGSLSQGTDATVVLRCGSQSATVTIDALTGEPHVNAE